MPNSPRQAVVYVGPSGWSYPDWAGIVYPRSSGARLDTLEYLSRYYNAIEINSSFYRPPTARTAASWVRRVHDPERFHFAMKLHQAFTHGRDAYTPAERDAFRAGIAPLAEAGLVGCVLMQFPWSFRCNRAALDRLHRLADDFGDAPLAVEVRHTSWDRPEVLDELRGMRLSFCNIDQPVLSHCLPPTAYATGPLGYVRLHGRREDTWFADNVDAHERYNYLYSPRELTEWIARIHTLAGQTDRLYVFANNCFEGKGAANALQIRALLEHRRVDVPPDMLVHYPFLREIASDASLVPRQRTLFD